MKYIYYGFNFLLIIIISIFIFVNPSKSSLSLNNDAKIMTTSAFKSIQMRKVEEKKVVTEAPQEEAKVEEVKEEVKEVVEPPVLDKVDTPTVETQVGGLAAYGPDCVGCSGYLATGQDARGGNIYYNDPTYGNIRILAGDAKYPFGTIVKVSGTSLGDFNAIVLDRGGGVGFGKRFLFDLLCPSNAEASGVGSFQNVTFEILRYGY